MASNGDSTTAALAVTGPISSDWDVAIAAYRQAVADDEAYNAVYNQIDAQRIEAVAAVPVKPLPADGWVGRTEGIFETATRNYWIRRAQADVEAWDQGKVKAEEYIREHYEEHIRISREVIAIDFEYRSAIQSIEQRLDYDAATEKWEALGEAANDALHIALATPAPDHAALLWKFERLLDDDGSLVAYNAETVAPVAADMRRLLGEGRAA